MKALEYELGLVISIVIEFYFNFSRGAIVDTCIILLVFVSIHYVVKNGGDLFE